MDNSFESEDDPYISIPFVLTQAQGGEYDTEAFQAGWNLGILDAKLALAVTADLIASPVVMPLKWKKQADLIAMSHSLVLEILPTDNPNYGCYVFGTPEFFADQNDSE